MESDCPDCRARPYLCFEHHEQRRAREDADPTTLELFSAYWNARMERERAAKIELGTQAFWLGRQVARGELLLATAHERLERMGLARDHQWPSPTRPPPLLTPQDAGDAIAEGFRLGIASQKKQVG